MRSSDDARTVSRAARAAVLLLGALALGCPQTDRERYWPGDPGQATYLNHSRTLTTWFGGCNAFVQQEHDGIAWVDRGGEVTCIWEGFADPLPPGETRVDPFTARTPGRWRLAYDIGFGCRADAPLSGANCRITTRVLSNAFEVLDPAREDVLCEQTGGLWDPLSCGHYLCGDAPDCRAIVPGCDCGPDASFVSGEGCVPDASCPGETRRLCEETGGVWDPTSCGHWSCGQRPICAAVIPGCNCGPFSVFEETAGCLAAPCGAPR